MEALSMVWDQRAAVWGDPTSQKKLATKTGCCGVHDSLWLRCSQPHSIVGIKQTTPYLWPYNQEEIIGDWREFPVFKFIALTREEALQDEDLLKRSFYLAKALDNSHPQERGLEPYENKSQDMFISCSTSTLSKTNMKYIEKRTVLRLTFRFQVLFNYGPVF